MTLYQQDFILLFVWNVGALKVSGVYPFSRDSRQMHWWMSLEKPFTVISGAEANWNGSALIHMPFWMSEDIDVTKKMNGVMYVCKYIRQGARS